jgi:hypothetical protein
MGGKLVNVVGNMNTVHIIFLRVIHIGTNDAFSRKGEEVCRFLIFVDGGISKGEFWGIKHK